MSFDTMGPGGKPPGPSFFYETTGKGDTGPAQLKWDGFEGHCGEIKGWLSCSEGHQRPVMIYCYRQECPVCARRWIEREVQAIERRIRWVRETVDVPVVHVVVGWDRLPTSPKEFSKMRTKSVQYLKKLGILGGFIVAHVKGGRIHYHVVGLGEIDRNGVGALYRRTGVVVKEIRRVDNERALGEYELDHAVKVEGKHTVSWFGCMHSRYVQVKTEEVRTEARCLHPTSNGLCGKVLREQRDVIHGDGGIEPTPVHYHTEIVYYFNWRRRPQKFI